MMNNAAAFLLNPEFWKLLLSGLTMVLSPFIHHALTSKFPPSTVNLFVACLPFVPILTYRANCGIVHLLYTPLLVAAALAMCVSLTALGNMVCQFVFLGLDSVSRFVFFCLQTVFRTTRQIIVGLFCSVGRVLVAAQSIVVSFRFRSVAIGTAASIVFPPLAALLVAVVALWIVYLLVRGICFVVGRFLAVIGAMCTYVAAVVTTIKDAVVGNVQAAVAVVGRIGSALASLLCRTVSLVVRTMDFLGTLVLVAVLLADPSAESLLGVVTLKLLMAIIVKLATVA